VFRKNVNVSIKLRYATMMFSSAERNSEASVAVNRSTNETPDVK
jgi:hypothetical protein